MDLSDYVETLIASMLRKIEARDPSMLTDGVHAIRALQELGLTERASLVDAEARYWRTQISFRRDPGPERLEETRRKLAPIA